MEKSVFLKKIESFIKKHNLLPYHPTIIVAVSGGADSVALLHSLKSLGYNIIVAHCNFHLRGEDSNRDESFVRNLAKSIDVEFRKIDFDVPAYERSHKLSTEMACRELRYDWFESLRAEKPNCFIAVGHHQDDNIETLFLNILRGSGLNGLTAIKPRNGYIVRPLLDVSRNDIENYLLEIGQDYVTDYTNNQSDFKRNKLRNIILPEIKNGFPGANTAILRTIENLTSCNEYFQAHIRNDISMLTSQDGETIRIDIPKLIIHEGRRTLTFEILKTYGFNSTQAEEVLNSCLTSNYTGKQYFSDTHTATLNRQFIEIICNVEEVKDNQYSFYLNDIPKNLPIALNCQIIVPDESFRFSRDNNLAYFDSSLLDKKLTLRRWHIGDRFTPFGMKGSKKVSDLLTDMKISRARKDEIYVLTHNEKIIWVIGLRSSDLFKCKLSANTPIIRLTTK